MNQLWYEKYRPTTFDELLLPFTISKTCKTWMDGFIKKDPKTPPCLFIYGPPGIGKTSMAKILLKTYGYEVIEFNASELRNASQVKSKIEEINGRQDITSLMCFKKRNIGIIMDEIDGMSSGDRGGLQELIDIIFPKKTKQKNTHKFPPSPFICISNTVDKKIKTLKAKSQDIRMSEPNKKQLFHLATQICEKESIPFDENVVLEIIPSAQGDYRRLVNLLEYLWVDSKKEGEQLEWIRRALSNFDKKNKHMDCYQITSKILLNSLSHDEVLHFEKKDSVMTRTLIEENALPHIIKNTKPNSNKGAYIGELYESFSDGAIYENLAFTQQAWDLMEYNSFLKTINTNYTITRRLEPYSYHRYTDINHSIKLNKNSHEMLFKKNRDELVQKIEYGTSDHHLPYFCNILVSKIVQGKYKEVVEFCNHQNISWDEFEKKICKWSNLDSKDYLTTSVKKNMKRDFLN